MSPGSQSGSATTAEIPFVARLAPVWSVGCAVLSAAGLGAARFGLLPSYPSFLLFVAGLGAGAVGGLGFGIAALRATRPGTGRAGRRRAVLGTGIGVLLTGAGLTLAVPAAGAPPIHDITTDLDDPPRFREVLRLPANVGRDLSYPHGGAGVPDKQRRAYPRLAPIELDVPPKEAFAAARQAVEDLGWPIVWANSQLGIIEATETSALFRFADDVVIRVRAAPHDGPGSVVDVRSTSRVGVSDLGANARRIQRFAQELEVKFRE